MQEIVYHTNYKLEDEYWWFRAKFLIARDMLQRIVRLDPGDKILDVGCGTGGFAKSVSDLYRVGCLDMSQTALDYCAKRGLTDLFNSALEDFDPTAFRPNAITMLDVIEHIDDDFSVVKTAYDLLPEGGAALVTVPAFKFLWSKHDEVHMHKRRYRKKQLVELLEKAGFRPEFASYYNFFLFGPALLKRILDSFSNRKSEKPVDEVSDSMNNLFFKIFKSEKNWLKSIRFPFGLSVIAVAFKK